MTPAALFATPVVRNPADILNRNLQRIGAPDVRGEGLDEVISDTCIRWLMDVSYWHPFLPVSIQRFHPFSGDLKFMRVILQVSSGYQNLDYPVDLKGGVIDDSMPYLVPRCPAIVENVNQDLTGERGDHEVSPAG